MRIIVVYLNKRTCVPLFVQCVSRFALSNSVDPGSTAAPLWPTLAFMMWSVLAAAAAHVGRRAAWRRPARERSDPMHMSTVHSLHASFCFLVNTRVHECAQFYVRERMCTYVGLVVLICLRGLVRAFTRACVCMEGSVCVCAGVVLPGPGDPHTLVCFKH